MRVPIIGQQQPQQQQLTPEQQEQIAKLQVMQSRDSMAARMYIELAVAHISDSNPELAQEVYEMQLRSLARKCMTAAKAFFEGIGVIQTAAQAEQGE